jgi:hypothetical protein
VSPKATKKVAKIRSRARRKAKTSTKRAGRLARVAPDSQSPLLLSLEHKQIADARPDLPTMVRNVENFNAKYTIGRRDNRAALMISFDWFAPMLSQKKNSEMAFLIVNRLLRNAPLHLISPTVKELSHLRKEDLTLLFWSIDKLPLRKKEAEEIRTTMRNPEVLDRLLKRFEIAQAIISAQEEGLYESAEHMTSQIDLEEEGSQDIQAETSTM